MDAHEYERAAHFLRDAKSGRAWFLSVYSQYLASERAALQEFHTMDGTRQQPPFPTNKCIADLYALVAGTHDPWLMFLEALFLYKLGRRDESITIVLNSLKEVPWNWSGWCLLGDCIDNYNDYTAVTKAMPFSLTHPVVWLFQIKILNDLYTPAPHLCDSMILDFENNPWILTQRARSFYILGYLREGQNAFETVVALHPHRLDSIDIFSSILFMTGDLAKLSHYASIYKTFKHSPEACVFIGNNYSLRGEHEKAAKYYIRATRLNPNFAYAYTLLGYSYIDMANGYAAIHAFRRTISITRKDFRAWLGLGQCYRTLNMYTYALYYYRRGQAIRPNDIAIWEGMGTAYEALNRREEAIHAYQMSIERSQHHRLPTVHYKLAKMGVRSLYNYEEVIGICKDQKPDAMSETHLKSLIEAADLIMREYAHLDLAKTYLLKAVECTNLPEEVLRARLLLDELTRRGY